MSDPSPEPGHADFDRRAAGRPDPRVRTPTRQHRLRRGDSEFTAGFFPAVGEGEGVWQIHDPDGWLILTVVADRLTEAQAEHADVADRLRAQAQQLTDRADRLDTERELIAGLAEQDGPGRSK